MSEFHTATTDKPDELANVLSRALGEKGKKTVNNKFCITSNLTDLQLLPPPSPLFLVDFFLVTSSLE